MPPIQMRTAQTIRYAETTFPQHQQRGRGEQLSQNKKAERGAQKVRRNEKTQETRMQLEKSDATKRQRQQTLQHQQVGRIQLTTTW